MSEERDELEARIAAYIDGELPPAEAARLEVFLANTDPKLAQQIISMIGDKHALSALPKAKASPDLAARIMEQVERGTLLNDVDQFITPRRPWWQSKAAVAAILLLVFGSFTYFILQAIHTTTTPWQAIVDTNSPRKSGPFGMAASVPAMAPASAVPANALAGNAPTPATPAVPDHLVASAGADKKDAANRDLDNTRRLNEAGSISAPSGDSGALVQPAAVPSPIASEALDRAGAQQSARSAATSPAPLLLAFTAETSDDFTRLHDALERISSNTSAGGAKPEAQSAIPSFGKTGTFVADNGPVSYHLALRPSQVLQLTQQFHLQPLHPGDDSSTADSGIAASDLKKEKSASILPENKESAAMAPPPSSQPAALADATQKSLADEPIDYLITMVLSASSTQPAAEPAK